MFTFRENLYRKAVRTFDSFILHKKMCILKMRNVIVKMKNVYKTNLKKRRLLSHCITQLCEKKIYNNIIDCVIVKLT